MSYESVVLADSPTLLWMLDEASGTTAADSTGNGNTGTYTGSVTLGVSGPPGVSATAVGTGVSAYVVETSSGTSPDVFSVEYWFQTSGASNGLSGFAASQTAGAGGNQDRSITMTSGNLNYFVYRGSGTDILSTSGTYDDGNWHYLAAVMSGSIMGLYLDGSLAVSQGGYAPGADYTGYWLAGATGSFPTYLSGSLSAFAVYPYALTGTQVATHYAAASGGGAASTPQPYVTPSLAAIQAASW